MNTASLELCKELFNLSHWDAVGNEDILPHRQGAPLYDLGYLLRKLPYKVNQDEHYGWFILEKLSDTQDGEYVARYGEQDHFVCQADSPEDACAMLCIELIKQKLIAS